MKQTTLIACLAASLIGCGPAPVDVDESDSGRTITLAVDQELVVALESNPSTGYTWSYELTMVGVIAPIESEYEPSEPPRTGSGGGERFRFVAAESGQTMLRFEYRRPWETETPPAHTVTYDVVIE